MGKKAKHESYANNILPGKINKKKKYLVELEFDIFKEGFKLQKLY